MRYHLSQVVMELLGAEGLRGVFQIRGIEPVSDVDSHGRAPVGEWAPSHLIDLPLLKYSAQGHDAAPF